MGIVSRTILFGYNNCQELATKWQNILDSFRHKTEKIPIDDIEGDFSPFTETQEERLKELVYEIGTATLSRNKTNLEKGVLSSVIFSWNINLNDDTLQSASFDGVDVSNNLLGNQSFNLKNTTSKTLNVVFSRNGGSITVNSTTTSNFYVPQYRGKIGIDEPDNTYSGLSGYPKTISSSTNLSLEVTLNNEHLFFICNSSSKTVRDNLTGFTLSLGDWNSTTAFMIKKSFTIILSDGTTENVTLYRTREKKTQTLNISLV